MTSAWERETRLTYGCMICREPAGRAIEVPRLPDVHVTYGMAALCDVCEAMAMGDNRIGLSGRWQDHWNRGNAGSPEDDVRSVLAWAGHDYPAEPEPAVWRDPAPRPLNGADAERWATLAPKVHGEDGDRVCLVGRVEGGAGPWRDGARVVRDGNRVRSEADDGSLIVICDGVTRWTIRDGVATAQPVEPVFGQRPHLHELDHRSASEGELLGFGQPIGPIEPVQYLDRSAWRFRFAAPANKPWDMRVIVDDITGLTLEARFGPASVTRWTEFRTDVEPDQALFTWDGPVQEAAELQAADDANWQAQVAARQRWFASQVDVPIVVPAGEVDVEVTTLEDNGAFQATLSGALSGSTARRPRADTWWELGWHEVHHRWSDNHFDWALNGDDGPIDEVTLAALRSQLP